jgi:hypothetical protein
MEMCWLEKPENLRSKPCMMDISGWIPLIEKRDLPKTNIEVLEKMLISSRQLLSLVVSDLLLLS